MTGLAETHAALRQALEPLGIDVGPEVLAVWFDRERAGTDPLPAKALRRVAQVTEQLAQERNARQD